MKEISVEEAFRVLEQDPKTIYLDVRSIPEFEEAHPIRAINIPLLHFAPGMGMMPNDDFVSVVQANLPKDGKILIGCKTGGRSARACEILNEIGYQDVTNVRGGFLGVIDNFGRLVEPGWSLLELPVCKECAEESHYEALASKSQK